MINPFEFVTANRIVFGVGTVEQVPAMAATFGKHALLISGSKSTAENAARLEQQLRDCKVSTSRFAVSGEPDVETIEAGMKAADGCDMVISLGGGSVIDTGKVIAGLITNGGHVLDYVE